MTTMFALTPFAFTPASLLALALMVWLLSGVMSWLLSGVMSWLLAGFARLSSLVSGAGGMLASLSTIVAAFQILHAGPVQIITLPVLRYAAEFSPLNGLLLLAMSVPALFCSLYTCAWLRGVNPRTRARTALLCNLLMAALTAAAISTSAFELILMMELAALCAYFMIVQTNDAKNRRAGLNQFLSGRLGTLCLILAFALLHHTSGSVNFEVLRHTDFTAGIKSVAFLLALTGFGLYAGIIPLHAWVPQSHSSAPAHAAALFSSALMKIAIIGIVKVSLDLLGAPPLWWGLMLLLAMPLLPWLIASLLRGTRLPNRLRGDVWACGYGHSADMVVTATGFAQPPRVMFAPLYRLRVCATPAALVTALHQGWLGAFCRRLAFIELAVLLVVTFA